MAYVIMTTAKCRVPCSCPLLKKGRFKPINMVKQKIGIGIFKLTTCSFIFFVDFSVQTYTLPWLVANTQLDRHCNERNLWHSPLKDAQKRHQKTHDHTQST